MAHNPERRLLLAGIGAAGVLAISRKARAASCGAVGPVGPTTPTLRDVYDKTAFTDQGLAEARTPLASLTGSATALYVISAPGVYYMTGNVTGVPGKSAVEIAADNVELECDGFVFLGVPGTLACIRTPSPQRCIGVYDAGFSHWQNTCVDLSNSSFCYCEESWFDSCDSTSNPAGTGTCALGPGGTIDDCNALSCFGSLMSVGPNGIIEECVNADGSGGCFFSAGPAVMEDNFALNNSGPSITVLSRGVVIGNRVVDCGGIDVGDGSVVSENDVSGTPGTAITVRGPGSNVEENHIAAAAAGIDVVGGGGGTVVDGNQISGVSVSGIAVVAGAPGCFVVRNCVRSSPGSLAFSIAAGSTFGTLLSVSGIGDLGGSGTAPDAWSNFEY